MTVAPDPVLVAVLDDYPVVVAGLAAVMALHPTRIRVVAIDWRAPIPDDVDVVLCNTFASGADAGLGLLDVVGRTTAKVVLFGGDLSEPAIHAAMRAGATAYISKRAPVDELVVTLEAIRRGEPVPSPTFDGSDVEGLGSWPGGSARLSPREAEVIALIARGHTNEHIAASLFLSVNSVKTYIRSGYRKIGVQRRTQAVLWALDNGLVSDRGVDHGAGRPELMEGVRAAVAAAVKVVAGAASSNLGVHVTADRHAAELVADQAAQDARAARNRVASEATRVRRAADLAALTAWDREDDPTSSAALGRAAELDSAASTAAAALHERTVARAVFVAAVVKNRAEQVSVTRSRLHRRIESEETTTTDTIRSEALDAADLVTTHGYGRAHPPDRPCASTDERRSSRWPPRADLPSRPD